MEGVCPRFHRHLGVLRAAAACPQLPANGLWAMVYYRILDVYGSDALLNSFAFLADYARTHAPPATAGAKEDLRILSLGVGAGANIACAMDTLRWPLGSAVRSELQKRFGTVNPFCADSDGDGFNAFNGDCDDTRSGSHLLAAEISGNGHDDDCDGGGWMRCRSPKVRPAKISAAR